MIFWLLFSWNIHSKEIRKIFDLLSIQLSLGIFRVRRMGETSRISSPFFLVLWIWLFLMRGVNTKVFIEIIVLSL